MARWLAKRYGYGTELHDLWKTENPDIDPKPSSSHWNMYRPVVQSLLKHPFRMRTGDYMCGHLLWLHASEANRHLVDRYCPLGCVDAQGGRRPDTWRHTFLCSRSGAADMLTTRHNAACRIVAAEIERGNLGRWLILKNFGRTDDEPEHKTVPNWMLEQLEREGLAHNKPDFIIVKGWPRHSPAPASPILIG